MLFPTAESNLSLKCLYCVRVPSNRGKFIFGNFEKCCFESGNSADLLGWTVRKDFNALTCSLHCESFMNASVSSLSMVLSEASSSSNHRFSICLSNSAISRIIESRISTLASN